MVLLAAGGCQSSSDGSSSTGNTPVEHVSLDQLPKEIQDQWRGKVVMADFWATWCGPCRASSPNVQKLADQFKDDPGVLIVGIHADDSNGTPEAYFKEHHYTYSLIPKGESLGYAFGVHALPTFVILDATGHEVYRHLGLMNETVRDQVAAKIKSLRNKG